LDTRLDASQTLKINTIGWQRNPANDNLQLLEYRVYRKRANLPDSDFSLIGAVPTTIFQYVDGGRSLSEKYTYGLTTVPKDPNGLESTGSEFVTEIITFPPLDAACRTVTNNSLFRREKINVVSWKRNPLNQAITVVQYNIYRKKDGQDDSSYQKIASVAGYALEYQDRKLSFNEKYHYVITAVDTGGYESARSSTARE
jgi:fibronectin type 3 domain-containing protein